MKCIGLGWNGQEWEMLHFDEKGNINALRFSMLVSFRYALSYVQNFAKCYEAPFCPMLLAANGKHFYIGSC